MRNGFFVPGAAGFVAAIPSPSHNVTGQFRPELIWRCPITERTIMIASTIHLGRLLLAWLGCYLFACIFFNETVFEPLMDRSIGGYAALLALLLGTWVASGVF